MKITKEQLKQIIKEELIESIINKEYDRPMTAGEVVTSIADAVGRHGAGPAMAQALRDIADQIDRSEAVGVSNWYDDEHETLADRKFADRPEDSEEEGITMGEPSKQDIWDLKNKLGLGK